MPGLRVLPVIDSRPPAVPWFADTVLPPMDHPGQPSLLELPDLTGFPAEPAAGLITSTDRSAGWQAEPDRRLPDATAWSSSLGLAAVEVARGRRPIGQLSRWVTEEELGRLARVAATARSRYAERLRPGPGPVQARVQSARVQFARADVAEAAVHVRIGPASVAVALRLDAVYDRWLATALRLVLGASRQTFPRERRSTE